MLSKNTNTLAALTIALVMAVLLGWALPIQTAQPQVFGTQAINYFRQLQVTANTDVAPLLLTQYSAPTQPPLQVNGSTGTPLFALSTTGGATFSDTVVAPAASFGGGWLSTGCDISSIGNLACTGKADFGGTSVFTGSATFQGAMTVNANGDFDSVSVAGNMDITTMNNTGAAPVTINDNLAVTGTVNAAGALTVASAVVTGTATADGFSGKYVTATIGTTDQPNIVNLGLQKYLSATNFSVATIMPSASGSAASVNYCMSSDCDTGLYYPGDNNIGLSTGGTVRAQISNSGLDAVGLSIGTVSFTGATKYGTLPIYTSSLSIVHGFVVTPTVCFITPVRDVTSTLTITATGFSSDMADVAAPIYWWCGQ